MPPGLGIATPDFYFVQDLVEFFKFLIGRIPDFRRKGWNRRWTRMAGDIAEKTSSSLLEDGL